MAEKRFDVMAQFRARTQNLDYAVVRSTRLIGRLTSGIAGVGVRLAGIGASAIGIAGLGGLGYAAFRATRSMIDLNRETETSRISIATMLQQASQGGRGPFEDFNRAIGEATRLQREFETRGAKLPGTVDDFRRGFELLLPAVAKTGAGIDDVLRLSERVVVASKVGNVFGGAETVARDINQILSGRASIAEIQTGALRDPAKQIAEVARKDRAKALEMINRALQVSPAALSEFERSFDARSSTFEDNIKRFLRSAGGPVFEYVNGKLGEWNRWLEKNADKVKEIAAEVGGRVVDGAKAFADFLESAAGRAERVADAVGRVYEFFAKDIPDFWDKGLNGGIGPGSAATGLQREVERRAEAARTMAGPITGQTVLDRILASANPNSGFTMDPREWAVYKRGLDRYFREASPGATGEVLASKFRADPFGTLRGDGIDVAPNIPDRVLLDLAKKADRFRSRQADTQRTTFERVLAGESSAGGFQLPASSMALAQQQAVDEYRRRQNMSDAQIEAEARAKFKTQDPSPTIDARGSTFRIEQRFEEGDPDRVALAVRDAVIRPFVPMLASR